MAVNWFAGTGRISQLCIYSFCLLPPLLGCDAKPIENTLTAGATEAGSPKLDGYGELKFGMSFTEALAQTDSNRFNPYGLKECLEDMPLKGCFLSPDTKAVPFIIEGGIPYNLMLEFNKYDRLTDIGLRYSREGKITREECLSLHGRTLDWVTRQFGKFYPSLREKEKMKQVKSPSGLAYLVYESDGENFLTNFMRTAVKPPSPVVRAKPIADWDNARYVSLLSHYLVVSGEPHCDINIDIQESRSVERRPYLQEDAASPEPEQSEAASDENDEVPDDPYADEMESPTDGNYESIDY